MAKITISRIFETSKILATEPGQILQDFINYMSQLAEQTLRNLRNGLTFTDNFDCLVSTVALSDGVDQVVNTSGRQPSGILPLRVVSTAYGADSFAWYIDETGATHVTMTFTNSPTKAQNVVLLILFG
jgi:hypothetical protein